MGFYINPHGISKELFLERFGEMLEEAPENFDFSSDKLPVCWMHNGDFTVAGIAYCAAEFRNFNKNDGRPKVWFLVSKKHLGELAGLWEGWIEQAQGEDK